MAHVSDGPVSTLPGHRQDIKGKGLRCDKHPTMPAVVRMQGETDSFGAEYADMCIMCLRQKPEPISGECDWCKQHDNNLRHRRDFEEGTSGRVYLVCGTCITRENEELDEDLADSTEFDYWPDDDD